MGCPLIQSVCRPSKRRKSGHTKGYRECTCAKERLCKNTVRRRPRKMDLEPPASTPARELISVQAAVCGICSSSLQTSTWGCKVLICLFSGFQEFVSSKRFPPRWKTLKASRGFSALSSLLLDARVLEVELRGHWCLFLTSSGQGSQATSRVCILA